jgi:magnesium-protoporphyrin O-methyltransferase
MADCCNQPGYQTVFSDRFARRVARTYRKRGLDRTQRRLVSFLTDRGIQNASVLEIGGGVGEMQIELLSCGRARRPTSRSRGYETEAAALLKRSGMADRVTRRFVDIATSPEEIESADVVVLHRVVCCYPDYERLLPRPPVMRSAAGVFPPAPEPVQQDDRQRREFATSTKGWRLPRIRASTRGDDRDG